MISTSRNLYKRRGSAGFTLGELMIVVAIISLLSMIALPSFMQNIRKSKRTDAHTALTRTAFNIERAAASGNTYNVGYDPLQLKPSGDDFISDDGYYVVTVDTSSTAYTITATAAAGSSQADDEGCTVLTIDSLGRRTPDPATSRCW